MIKCGERFENDCHPFIILRGKKRMNRVKCDSKRDFFQIIFILSGRKNVYKTHKKSNLLRLLRHTDYHPSSQTQKLDITQFFFIKNFTAYLLLCLLLYLRMPYITMCGKFRNSVL